MRFLKPKFRTLIIPIVLIIMYLIVTNYMYSFTTIGDKYICEITGLGEKAKLLYEQNNTAELNKTVEEIQYLSSEWREEMPKNVKMFTIAGNFLETINPVFPTPCSMASDNHYCRYYLSEETYNCFTKTYEENEMLGVELRPYKKVNLFHHIFALFVLFVEGYVFSILVFIGYNFVKSKIQKIRKKPNNFGF